MIWLWIVNNWRVVAVVGVLAVLSAGHLIATQRAYNRGYAASENEHLIAQAKADEKAGREIFAADQKHYMDMEIANAQNDKLLTDIRSGAVRLSIRVNAETVCASMGDGETRADIDSRDASSLIAIANRGDQAIRQLTFAQEIIRILLGEPNA